MHATHFLSLCLSAEGTDSVTLSEIYSKLDEIEADKAPARYLWQPGTQATLQDKVQLSSGHVSVLTDLCLLLSEPPSSSPGLDSLQKCSSRPQSEFANADVASITLLFWMNGVCGG